NINEAKINGVFIKQYLPSEQKIILNDSISFEFDEIWMEYPWMYINQNKDIEIDKSNNGIVLYKFKNETDITIKNKGIEIFSKEIPYSGYNNIYFELDNVNIKKDTIDLIINFNDQGNEGKKIVLDSQSIKLIKK